MTFEEFKELADNHKCILDGLPAKVGRYYCSKICQSQIKWEIKLNKNSVMPEYFEKYKKIEKNGS